VAQGGILGVLGRSQQGVRVRGKEREVRCCIGPLLEVEDEGRGDGALARIMFQRLWDEVGVTACLGRERVAVSLEQAALQRRPLRLGRLERVVHRAWA
jgi:hypothetical protein